MFAVIPENKTNVNRPKFVSVTEGNPVLLQFLSDQASRFYVHSIKTSDGKIVKVLHQQDCIICKQREYWERAKPYYMFRAAVLDVTPVVICPKCGAAYSTIAAHKVPELCPQDGVALTGVGSKPLNEVKIFEGGITVFKSINAVMDTLAQANVNLKKLVLMLMASGTGLKKVITVIPRVEVQGIEYTGELPDLNLPEYSAAEVEQMFSGVPLNRILDARKDNSATTQATVLDFSNFNGILPGVNSL